MNECFYAFFLSQTKEMVEKEEEKTETKGDLSAEHAELIPMPKKSQVEIA